MRCPLSCLLLLASLLAACSSPSTQPDGPPNIVIIFTDDQGYADLGSYGAEGFTTPHLDQMAAEGMRFTDFYVASGGCSPSRAALLTGSYPQRVGIPHVLSPQSTIGLHPDEVTIADLLKPLGYATACFGKWHLGHRPQHLPPAQGFDAYLGIPYSNDMTPDSTKNPNPYARRHPPLPLIEGVEVMETEPDQTQLTRRYTEHAVAFIEQNKDRPFFLYLPHTFPHVPLFASEAFRGRSARGLYGDVIMEIDWSVGQVLGTLDRLGLSENTLVVFTSDNGPWLVKGEHSGSTGPLREGKGTTFEGGQRVPCLMRWPGTIPAGAVSREMVTAMDLLPTIARLTGAALPQDRRIDGKDIGPLITGQPGATTPHEAFFFYWGRQLQAVRSGVWKLHVPHRYRSMKNATLASASHPGQYTQDSIGVALFNLEDDIGETTNLADAHPDVVERLMGLMAQARADLGDALTDREGTHVRPPSRVE